VIRSGRLRRFDLLAISYWPAAASGGAGTAQVPSNPCARLRPPQRRPMSQAPPPQQAWPDPPQPVSHVPAPFRPVGLLQPRPALQLSPGQQVWPAPPHGVQLLPPSAGKQPSDAWQRFVPPPWQQACPELPHVPQVPPIHDEPLAVQNCAPPNPPPAAASAPPSATTPPQQAWPTAPQGCPAALLHAPPLQVPDTPLPAQVWPAPTHRRCCPPPPSGAAVGTQQPPPLQLLAAQHGWPGAPQATVPPAPPLPPLPPVDELLPPHPKAANDKPKITVARIPRTLMASPPQALVDGCRRGGSRAFVKVRRSR
jgi:hypothetical protein